MQHHLSAKDKNIILIGTAHVSEKSAEQVKKVIEEIKPDTVCVELCASRYSAIKQENRWQQTDIFKIIKEKKVFLLLSHLLLASFQKKIAKRLDIRPGAEMLQAINSAEKTAAKIELIDRDISITLSRTWRQMGFFTKLKLLGQLLTSFGDIDEITEEEIENLKDKDVLQTVLEEFEKSIPVIKSILITERDRYMAEKIRSAPGRSIVAVVGAGHLPGILKYWEEETDIKDLESLPEKRAAGKFLKWLLPAGIIFLITYGFYLGGASTGGKMIGKWVLANGLFAGIGAAAAFGHPLTVASAILAAPLTSLNPMIAAGWVSGLVEAFARRPRVRDFENLSEDIVSFKGFWKNKVTRVLLVVVLTNLGSTVGTLVAIPMIFKLIPS